VLVAVIHLTHTRACVVLSTSTISPVLLSGASSVGKSMLLRAAVALKTAAGDGCTFHMTPELSPGTSPTHRRGASTTATRMRRFLLDVTLSERGSGSIATSKSGRNARRQPAQDFVHDVCVIVDDLHMATGTGRAGVACCQPVHSVAPTTPPVAGDSKHDDPATSSRHTCSAMELLRFVVENHGLRAEPNRLPWTPFPRLVLLGGVRMASVSGSGEGAAGMLDGWRGLCGRFQRHFHTIHMAPTHEDVADLVTLKFRKYGAWWACLCCRESRARTWSCVGNVCCCCYCCCGWSAVSMYLPHVSTTHWLVDVSANRTFAMGELSTQRVALLDTVAELLAHLHSLLSVQSTNTRDDLDTRHQSACVLDLRHVMMVVDGMLQVCCGVLSNACTVSWRRCDGADVHALHAHMMCACLQCNMLRCQAPATLFATGRFDGIIALTCHEIGRVYRDRLFTTADRDALDASLDALLSKHCRFTARDVTAHTERLQARHRTNSMRRNSHRPGSMRANRRATTKSASSSASSTPAATSTSSSAASSTSGGVSTDHVRGWHDRGLETVLFCRVRTRQATESRVTPARAFRRAVQLNTRAALSSWSGVGGAGGATVASGGGMTPTASSVSAFRDDGGSGSATRVSIPSMRGMSTNHAVASHDELDVESIPGVIPVLSPTMRQHAATSGASRPPSSSGASFRLGVASHDVGVGTPQYEQVAPTVAELLCAFRLSTDNKAVSTQHAADSSSLGGLNGPSAQAGGAGGLEGTRRHTSAGVGAGGGDGAASRGGANGTTAVGGNSMTGNDNTSMELLAAIDAELVYRRSSVERLLCLPSVVYRVMGLVATLTSVVEPTQDPHSASSVAALRTALSAGGGRHTDQHSSVSGSSVVDAMMMEGMSGADGSDDDDSNTGVGAATTHVRSGIGARASMCTWRWLWCSLSSDVDVGSRAGGCLC